MELSEFLAARLDEDEAAAKAATPGPWWAVQGKHQDDGKLRLVKASDPEYPAEDPTYATRAPHVVWSVTSDPDEGEQADLRHIARHDPARVLAEVAAGRKLLAEYELFDGDRSWANALEFAIQCRASVYSGHPDYDPAWAPEGAGT